MVLPTCHRCDEQPATVHVTGGRLPAGGRKVCQRCLPAEQRDSGGTWTAVLIVDDPQDALFEIDLCTPPSTPDPRAHPQHRPGGAD